MPEPLVHLRRDRNDPDLTVGTACGIVAWNWTDDAQAVTCQRCIGRMELQPA